MHAFVYIFTYIRMHAYIFIHNLTERCMDHELFKACFSISKAFFKYLAARTGSLASRYVPPILLTVDATF